MERIQMTEEQFIQMYRDCGRGMIGSQNYEDWRLNMIKYGYIRKSELQQKVEEAEDDYDNYVKNFIDIESDDRNELIEDLYKLVQLLKQSHPELMK